MFIGSKKRKVEDSIEAAYKNYAEKPQKFSIFFQNMFLDIHTKRAAWKASRALVSLVSSSEMVKKFSSSL